MELIAKTIGEWVALDRTNIVNRQATMDWVLAPLAYETNESPWASSTTGVVFYTHPSNLNKYSSNLGRVATMLAFVLRNAQTGVDITLPPWSARLSALRDLLRSHWEVLDQPTKQFLTVQGLRP
jgi:hypothetical protein